MIIRQALVSDIPALHTIRMAVKENVLSNPALVTEEDYRAFLTTAGRGWLCEAEGAVAGFAILDKERHNVWALFVHPGHEGKGIGRRLQQEMLQWYFAQTDHTLWLSTGPGTRAEEFYRRTGWRETGRTAGGETRFEMSREDWRRPPPQNKVEAIKVSTDFFLNNFVFFLIYTRHSNPENHPHPQLSCPLTYRA